MFLLKSAIVLYGLVAFRHTAFAGKIPTFLTLTWNVLLPLVCLNFVIALIAETCLQPGDMLSRFLLAWIVVGGGTALRITVSSQNDYRTLGTITGINCGCARL